MVAPPVARTSGFSGLIIGINGQPCGGANVFVGSGGVTVARATANDQGAFAVELPPGDYTLTADDDMGASEPLALALEAGERLDGLELDLKEHDAPANAEPVYFTVETGEDGRKIFRIQTEIIID
ncbi:MAG TPA: carboxypeptidase-like regulatory domain-containing protein [Polyangia bacterium]|nr:carboxypeptidase-like regulatory domain-containing protein [Polyangia bacterium]